MSQFTYPIILGIIAGIVVRVYMLRTDYRQYPTYLHGKTIHIAQAMIAAAIGAVIIPSILKSDYTAITFLTLAATQFRDVRNMERETLTQLDGYELVSRGSTYIEGIAIAFESRNYIVIFTSLLTTLAYILFKTVWAGLGTALICIIIGRILMSGSFIKHIADIEHKPLHFDGQGLYVDDIYIMNIGIPEKQKLILEHGMGFVLKPKNFNSAVTLANLGQRQAILFDVSNVLGVYRDSGEPSLTPLAKRDLNDGRVAIFVLPAIKDQKTAIRVIGDVPTLENAIRVPMEFIKEKHGKVIR
ncbi:membrane protein [Bacillus glycinifermentans]|uniref:YIEGIA family protein n=1 Tax=Bacillus glycinifermentans TaxID=1664069 RepID=UPI0006542460|nr:YIEGIA family protein [Bacillus glycinifermentans]KMM61384.1 membrane protein [Bacillus glycinifermentans]MEC0494645.1 YIEGIA family protein [Bacillus glycinifermentans]MEC0541211.1 YIEGIA family protein [Bacillus glycinifermentans]MEC3608988.1 YIEGIA family protein [Bacillus glycinifermentans]